MNQLPANGNSEETFVANNNFYQSLIDKVLDGIAIITFDGSVKFYSHSVEKILGYSQEDSSAQNFFALVHPDDKDKCSIALEKLMTEPNIPILNSVRFRHKDGSWKDLEAKAVNLADDPDIQGILINLREVTERLLIQQSLKESEMRYRSLIENSFDGITIIDFDEVVKYHSPSLLEILGYRPASGIGKSILELLHPDDHRIFYDSIPVLKNSAGHLVTNIVRFKHKNGSWVILETRFVNLLDKPGIEGILINYRDITQSENLKEALRENAERYKTIVETAPEAIFLIDTSTGAILDFNQRAMEMFGYSREHLQNMKGIHLSPRTQPDGISSLEFIKAKIQEALGGRNVSYEWHHKDFNDRLFPCEVRITHFPPYDKKVIRGTIVDISKRKQIETSLKESEERYRNFTETAPETIFIVDAETGKFIDCNKNATKLFGYSREKLLSMRAIELSPPRQPDGRDSLAAAKDKLRLALRENNIVYEWHHINSKGKIFPTETRLVRFPPYDKKYIRGTVNDITARKVLEEKLKQQEKDYRHLANVSPVGIFRTDTKGRTVFVNEKWCEITGLSFEEATGNGWQSAIHPDDRDGSLKDWKKAFKLKEVSNAVFRFQTPQGRINWVYGQAVPDKDERGNVIGYVGSVTDITERMHAIEALAKSEKRNSVLLKAIPDMIFRLSKTGVFLDFKAATNFGPLVPPEFFIGKRVKEVLPPPIAKLCMKNVKQALKTNAIQTFNYSLADPSNPEKLNFFEARILTDDNNEALALIRDISQQKEAEQELRETNGKLKALYQRLETIREEEKKNIAMEIHDELGQELTAMKLGMFWLQQYINQHRKRELDIFQVEDKVKSLIDLSSQTISSARRLAHQLRPVILDNLGLIPAIEWQIKSVNESGSVECEFRHNIRKVKFSDAFSVAFFRIIQESLTNILRHSEAKKALVKAHATRSELQLTIQDNGKGIEKEDLSHPDKFGIFGMKERVKTWSGKFELKGTHGKGTLLTFTFPLKEVVKKHDKHNTV